MIKYVGKDEKAFENVVLKFSNYNEATGNTYLITDLMYYIRKTLGITFGPSNVPYDLKRWTWGYAMDQFKGCRKTPIKMPRAHIEQNQLVSRLVFTDWHIMKTYATFPGIPNNNKKKYGQGIRLKAYETSADTRFMALNAGDRSGDRSYMLAMGNINADLEEDYKAFINRSKSKMWDQIHKMIDVYKQEVPNGPSPCKEGMTIEEQFLAHLDSAGAFFNKGMDEYCRENNLVSFKDTYKCSLDFEEEIRKAYGNERVGRYFDVILKSKEEAAKIMMYYKY